MGKINNIESIQLCVYQEPKPLGATLLCLELEPAYLWTYGIALKSAVTLHCLQHCCRTGGMHDRVTEGCKTGREGCRTGWKQDWMDAGRVDA